MMHLSWGSEVCADQSIFKSIRIIHKCIICVREWKKSVKIRCMNIRMVRFEYKMTRRVQKKRIRTLSRSIGIVQWKPSRFRDGFLLSFRSEVCFIIYLHKMDTLSPAHIRNCRAATIPQFPHIPNPFHMIIGWDVSLESNAAE